MNHNPEKPLLSKKPTNQKQKETYLKIDSIRLSVLKKNVLHETYLKALHKTISLNRPIINR